MWDSMVWVKGSLYGDGLVEFLPNKELIIANTLFKVPRSYIILSLTEAKMYPRKDTSSDHNSVVMKIRQTRNS